MTGTSKRFAAGLRPLPGGAELLRSSRSRLGRFALPEQLARHDSFTGGNPIPRTPRTDWYELRFQRDDDTAELAYAYQHA
jgi:hypothetical protein